MRIATGGEVHAPVERIGGPAVEEPSDERLHRTELARRVWHHVRAAPAEAAHVVAERALFASPERSPIDAVARRALEDGLVDVGNVLCVADAGSARLQEAGQHVENDERPRVAKVRRVVRRHAADVHRQRRSARSEREYVAASRVVEPEHPRRTISSPAVTRFLARDEVIEIVRRIASPPTAPYHEFAVLEAIRGELEAARIATRTDAFGQVYAHLARGSAKRALVFAAHTDHPAFEVTDAQGTEGRARVLGGFRQRVFPTDVPVMVQDDAGAPPFRATLLDPEASVEPKHNSTVVCRIRADRELRVGQFAVLDMPGVEVVGDEIRMRAADDLAGCALIVCALLVLREDDRPHDIHAIFTRAEETGLYGARLAAEDGLIPRDAFVVSVEASRALPGAEAGKGVVVRAGDLHNTFSNEAERYLRVARERLADAGMPVQRALLVGGTCEASAFVRLGWTATGMALPNVNYHNAAPDGGFAPEIVRVSDLASGIALAVEAAIAAAEDASESWWPDVRVVPSDIRSLLRRPRRDE